MSVPRREVVAAVEAGKFHLYPVRSIDDGLEILTGVKAGNVHEPGTIHHRAAQRLRHLAEGLRRFGTPEVMAAAVPVTANGNEQAGDSVRHLG